MAAFPHIQLFCSACQFCFFKAFEVFPNIWNQVFHLRFCTGNPLSFAFITQWIDTENNQRINQHIAIVLSCNIKSTQSHQLVLRLVSIALRRISPGCFISGSHIGAALFKNFCLKPLPVQMHPHFVPVDTRQLKYQCHSHLSIFFSNILTGISIRYPGHSRYISVHSGIDNPRTIIIALCTIFIGSNADDGIAMHNRSNKLILCTQCQQRFCIDHIQKKVARFRNIKCTATDRIIKLPEKTLCQNRTVTAFTHINKVQFPYRHKPAQSSVFTKQQCFHAIARCRYRRSNSFRFGTHDNHIIAHFCIFRIAPDAFLGPHCAAGTACQTTADTETQQYQKRSYSFMSVHVILLTDFPIFLSDALKNTQSLKSILDNTTEYKQQRHFSLFFLHYDTKS